MNIATAVAACKRLRHPAHTSSAPDSLATLRRLVAVPVPLSDLPAITQAAGIKRPVAQGALSSGLRNGTVTLASVGGVVCVVAAEGGAP